MRDCLVGYHFTVMKDHLSLKLLGQIDNPSDRLARWAMDLSRWDFTIKYRRGNDNLLADTLSRQSIPTCAISKHKDWYHRRMRIIEEDPEYTIRDGKMHATHVDQPWQMIWRLHRATTKIHRWTHLTPRNARQFHQVDRIAPIKEGHRKSSHRSSQNSDLPLAWMPRSHRDQ